MVVTQDCNYACTFCHGEGMQTQQVNNLSADDYAFMFSVGKNYFGFETTTLSGGEPLFRKDIVDIAEALYNKGAKISVTTNGSLLDKRMGLGLYADRINVSLHTLDHEKYSCIVQKRNMYDRVLANIDKFRETYPEVEVRLNAALVEGVNTSEKAISEYLKYARIIGASVKYLELFPPGAEGFFPLDEAALIIQKLGYFEAHSDTRKLEFQNGSSRVGLSKIFCSCAAASEDPASYCYRNNDIFVTPEGKMKPCRSVLYEIDFLNELKKRDEEGLASKIDQAFSALGKTCVLDFVGNKAL